VTSRKIVIASGNPGKVKEFKLFLSSLPVKIISQPNGFKVEETGASFVENARIKALSAADFTGDLALADDSGLTVEALNGAPGIHSARYAKTDLERVKRLLRELAPFKNRNASFHAALCFASSDDGVLIEVEGVCKGSISKIPRGDGGFGYDPIFQVQETELTFAEMGVDRKKELSHRGAAFKLLMPQLKRFFDY